MLNLRQKSINIRREALLEALRINLTKHATEYEEAVTDYKEHTIKQLAKALENAKASPAVDVLGIRVHFQPPQDHRADYMDAIEMLEYSADDLIQLDQESFKAYVKNQWAWTDSFRALAASYKA